MSSTPIENFQYFHRRSAEESPSNCQDCRRSRLELQESLSSQESSSDNESQSISIHVNANTMKNQSSRLQKLEEAIEQLKTENHLLSKRNKELMKQLGPISNSEKQLKKQLKTKLREVAKMKTQMDAYSYGMSVLSKEPLQSELASPRVVYEEKNYRLRSKSGRKSKDSRDNSRSKDFHYDDLKIKKKQWQIERTNYENKIVELQQKIQLYESEMGWAANLSYKLVSMAEKVAYLFKQKVINHKDSLRQQAKSGWRYLKHVLGYLLQID